MTALVFRSFKGEAPRVATHLLPEGFAQTARNAKLLRGMLEAWKAPGTVLATVSGVKSWVKYDGAKWLGWTSAASVVTDLVPGDTSGRVFWTGGGAAGPRQSNRALLALGSAAYAVDTANSYPLGLPVPEVAAAVAVGGGAPVDIEETRTYVLAWAYGAVVGGKTAEFSVGLGKGQSAYISDMTDAPPATFGGSAVSASSFRRFLFAVDAVSGQYLLVAKLAHSTTDYTDARPWDGKRYKAGAFKAGQIAAPAVPDIEAVDSPVGALGSRSYVYCWTYVLNGVSYHTDSSSVATLTDVEEGDTVFVTGMTATLPTFPAGATAIRRAVFRTDGDGDYRLVARVRKEQREYIDRKRTGKLGRLLSSWTLATVGSPAAPTVTIKTADDSAEVEKETRFYRWAWVTAWGEESAPGVATDVVDVLPWQEVTLTLPTAGPAGYANVTTKRVYRTDRLGVYRFAADVPLASATWVDTLEDVDLGEEITTTEWDPPPAGLSGIVALPNGVMAGFAGNEVMFSEPGYPYAWPVAYRYPVDAPIVALAVTGQGVVVGTQGRPYLCRGMDPASMAPDRIEEFQACVAARSMVDMGNVAVYASPNGLVAVSGMEAPVVTRELMTRDQWQALNPSSIEGYLTEGRYLGTYDPGTGRKAFLFDPADGHLVFLDVAATGGFLEPASGLLYLQVGANLCAWDTGAALAYTWKSGRALADRLLAAVVARVDAAAYPVTLKVYGDGALLHTQTVADARPFRLGTGRRVNAVEVEVTGSAAVRSVVVGENVRELG